MNSFTSSLQQKTFYQKVILLACLLGLTTLFSCKKDIQDPLLLSISPEYLVMDVTGGTNLPLTINASGPKNLQRFRIQVQINNTKTTILDSTLEWGSKFSLLYNYAIPASSENYSMVIYFLVLDSDGNTAQASRTLNVAATATTPTEKTGMKIASLHSGNADAVDLLNQQAVMSTLVDAGLQDMLDVPNTTDAGTLSHSWKSGNGAKFLSFDGFNYASATKETIEAAFTSGASVSQVNSLAPGSVVIVQTNRGGVKRYYAIQITAVNEDTVGDNDFYLFSMKY
jgi:hypothetical protein